MALATRPPTGAVGWPMVLLEGREGARKTSEALRLTADPRIGASYVIEVGEHRVDEYATLGNFLVVQHDGSLAQIVRGIRDVMAQPPLEGRPTLLIIDSGTALWDLVKREAERLARSSKSARERLAQDENAEIEVGHQAWNRAKDPWYWSWLNDLRAWPGIFVLTARADEVSKFVDGRPVANQTDYRIDIERGTPYIFDATVRMRGADAALVTTAKSLNFSVPKEGIELPSELPLAHLVFDLFKAGTDVELTTGQAKTALMAMARSVGHDEDSAKIAAAEAWKACNASSRTKFDHLAMGFLIEALPAAKANGHAAEPSAAPHATDPEALYDDATPSPDAPDSAPQEAHSAPEPSVAPDMPPDAPGAPQAPVAVTWDAASLPPERTAKADLRWVAVAPVALVAECGEAVKALDAGEVTAALEAEDLPTTGNAATQAQRLAMRRIRLAMEEAGEPEQGELVPEAT